VNYRFFVLKTAGTRSPAFLLSFPFLVELRGIEPLSNL